MEPVIIGYARGPHGGADIAALREAGCSDVFTDTCAGVPNEGEGLLRAIETARWGRILVVPSVSHLTEFWPQYGRITDALARCRIVLRELEYGLDTTTATGRHNLARAINAADTVEDYARAQVVLERWEPLLAAACEVAAKPTMLELEAELDKINKGRLTVFEFIRRSAPVNAALRDLDGCIAGAPYEVALYARRRRALCAELDAIDEAVALQMMTADRAAKHREAVSEEIRSVDMRLVAATHPVR